MNNTQESRPIALPYLLFSFAYIGVMFATSEWFLESSAYMIAVLAIIISIPIMVTYAYLAAIRRTSKAMLAKGKLKKWLSGFIFRIVVSFFLSIVTSYYMILSIIGSSEPFWYLWAAVGVSVPLMFVAYLIFGRPAKSNAADFIQSPLRMVGASLIVSLLITIGFGVATWHIERPLYDSYWCALDAQLTYSGSNPIVKIFFELYRLYNAGIDFGMSIIRTASDTPIVWFSVYLLNTFLFFVGITSAIAIFLVGWKNAVTRIVAEPNHEVSDDKLPPLKSGRILFAILTTLSLVGLYFFLLFGPVERIGGNIVFAGTSELVQSIEERRQDELSAIRNRTYTATIEPEIHAAFETVRSGVPHFLDWYYSLPAELGRLPLAVFGKLDERISDKMLEHLSKDAPFSDLIAELEVLDRDESTLNQRASQDIERVLDACKIERPEGLDSRIIRSMSESDISDIISIDKIPYSVRLGASLGTGTIVGIGSGVVVSRIVSGIVAKTIARGTVKKAAQAVVSAGTRAAVGVATGAATGAAVGTTVGPVGTVVGAIVGVGAAIMVDFGAIKLEEYLNRDELEGEIMKAIEIAEREVMLETERLLGIDE